MAVAGVRERAWQGRLDAESKHRYFGRLSDRYRRFHIGLILAFGLTSAATTVVAITISRPGVLIAVLSGIATALAIVTISLDLSGKAAMAASASDYYARLSTQWRNLWWRQHAAGVGAEIRDLEQQDTAGPYVPIGDDEKLLKECEQEVDKIILSEYSRA